MLNFQARVLVLMSVAVCLTVTIFAFVINHIGNLEDTIENLETFQIALQEQTEEAGELNRSLQERVAFLEGEIQTLQKPQSVGGPASFPISRVLARRNDTVLGLAQREKTTVDIIYALNSWLGESKELVAGQALWIPSQ